MQQGKKGEIQMVVSALGSFSAPSLRGALSRTRQASIDLAVHPFLCARNSEYVALRCAHCYAHP
jgi:hypothetical protein